MSLLNKNDSNMSHAKRQWNFQGRQLLPSDDNDAQFCCNKSWTNWKEWGIGNTLCASNDTGPASCDVMDIYFDINKDKPTAFFSTTKDNSTPAMPFPMQQQVVCAKDWAGNSVGIKKGTAVTATNHRPNLTKGHTHHQHNRTHAERAMYRNELYFATTEEEGRRGGNQRKRKTHPSSTPKRQCLMLRRVTGQATTKIICLATSLTAWNSITEESLKGHHPTAPC